MITTVWAKTYRPIGEMPRYCILFLHNEFQQVPVKITRGKFSGRVVVTPESGRSFTMDSSDMVTGLIPESWESARLDIEFDLMQKGAW